GSGERGVSPGPVRYASSVLAWVRSEPGADQVETVLEGAVFSTVNASETAQKLIQHEANGSWAISELNELVWLSCRSPAEDDLAAHRSDYQELHSVAALHRAGTRRAGGCADYLLLLVMRPSIPTLPGLVIDRRKWLASLRSHEIGRAHV